MTRFLSVPFLGLLLISCQECFDCDGFIAEPLVQIQLLDGDSINSVSDDLDLLEAGSDSLNAELDTVTAQLIFLRDTLVGIEDSIANGGDLVQLRDLVLELITRDSSLQIVLTDSLTLLDEEISYGDSILGILTSGYVIIDSVVNNLNGYYLDQYPDTVTTFDVPLNFNGANTEIRMVFYNAVYQLSLGHTNEPAVSIDGNVTVDISEIEVATHTFDSVILECTTCAANETLVICYY